MRRLVLVAVVSSCAGKPHVMIPAPPASATAEHRVQVFQDLRTAGAATEVTTTCNRGACNTTRTDLLYLRNGTEIRYAEDLLPVLPADGPAAAAARDAAALRQRSKRWRRTGWLMFVGGFVVSMVAFSNENDPLMYAGLASVVGGTFAVGHAAFAVDKEIGKRTRIVFDQYDASLATKLDVCVNGITVVPCEVTGGRPPPATEVDPAVQQLRQK